MFLPKEQDGSRQIHELLLVVEQPCHGAASLWRVSTKILGAVPPQLGDAIELQFRAPTDGHRLGQRRQYRVVLNVPADLEGLCHLFDQGRMPLAPVLGERRWRKI